MKSSKANSSTVHPHLQLSQKRRSDMSQSPQKRQPAPEDNWNLVGNPTIYLDELPQPFRFINKCLDQLVLKPVFNQITSIEQQKQTTEYEGYLKEVVATGFVELEGVTCLNQAQVCVGAGGLIDKEGYSSIANKMLIGDKFGCLHLLDVSRKLVLDKVALFEQPPRRIQKIVSATVVWAETKLSYVCVVARASPVVKILAFKHNENKLIHLYSMNTVPSVANPDQIDPEQSYLEFPASVCMSLDCLFFAVTTYGGEVKVFKMPPIINPLKEEESPQPLAQDTSNQKLPPSKATPSPQLIHPKASGTNVASEEIGTLQSDIEHLSLQQLDYGQHLLSKIEARRESPFVDPFKYREGAITTNESSMGQQQQVESEPPLTERNNPKFEFRFVVGKSELDAEGGDAGCLLKETKFKPEMFFYRSICCSRLQQEGAPKSIKQCFVTTGLVIAYLNTFDIDVYYLQRPIKENIPLDYSEDYFNKVLLQRKLASKKKNEKSLAALIKSVRQKEEQSMQAKSLQFRQEEMARTKEALANGPIKTLKMPYFITCAAFQEREENFQGLAVGLVDGAVVLLDMVLGMERRFLEKHPSEISTLAFYEDKVLMSGSICGRVNLSDLEEESEKPRILRCQNCQDRKIPVSAVIACSDFGVGIAVDIEGNCRFYDLIRLRKMTKVSSYNQRDFGTDTRFLEQKNTCKWRQLPGLALAAAQDTFLGVSQLPKAHWGEIKPDDDSQDLFQRQVLSERHMLVPKKFSDNPRNLKSLKKLSYESPEAPFFLQQSTLCLFRFEDVIMTLYPHLASFKRKGMTMREIFQKQDPLEQKQNVVQQAQQILSSIGKDQENLSMQHESRKNLQNKSVISGASNRKSEHFSVNFNLGPPPVQSQEQYDIPTLKRLNPELYKEYAKQQKQMKDPTFQSIQHIKERCGYHEMRVQRIQKRTEEIAKELEVKNQEQILSTRKQHMSKQ